MEFPTHFKFVFTALLLTVSLNDVYGSNPDGSNNNGDKKAPASTGASSSQKEDKGVSAITTILVNSHDLTDDNKFFSYSVTTNPRDMFKFPLKIGEIKFNGKLLTFEDGAKLPSNPATLFILYTCKHGNLLLVNIKSQGQNYFYALNADGKLWTNCALECLKDFTKTDPNGVTYYEYDVNDKTSNVAELFYNQLNKKRTELSRKRCDKKCKGNLPQNPTLGITQKVEKPPEPKPEQTVQAQGQAQTPQSQNKQANTQPEQPNQTSQNQNNPAETQKQEQTDQNQSRNTQSQPLQGQSAPNTPQPNQGNSADHDTGPVTADNYANHKKQTISCKFDFEYAHKVGGKDVKQTEQTGGQQADVKDSGTLLFTYYSFEINKENRTKIANSIAVTQCAFNNTQLTFYDLSKLPNRECWGYFRVFACSHNVPVMLRIKVTEDKNIYHYYYALDAQTKKFRNIDVSSLEEKQETDAKGLIRHSASKDPTSEGYSKRIEKIWEEKFASLCQSHTQTTETSKSNAFTVTIVLSEEQAKEGGTKAKKSG